MSTSYKGGAVDPTKWTELTLDQWPDGSSWDFVTSKATISAGSNIRIAFRYTSDSKDAATWEIKAASIK
ncbi:MAG: choice-of-anchor J domain-containing protein [Prevotella sp.]|nr:choice-of-anchor J domain-containing protein [Prevotella sp.]